MGGSSSFVTSKTNVISNFDPGSNTRASESFQGQIPNGQNLQGRFSNPNQVQRLSNHISHKSQGFTSNDPMMGKNNLRSFDSQINHQQNKLIQDKNKSNMITPVSSTSHTMQTPNQLISKARNIQKQQTHNQKSIIGNSLN